MYDVFMNIPLFIPSIFINESISKDLIDLPYYVGYFLYTLKNNLFWPVFHSLPATLNLNPSLKMKSFASLLRWIFVRLQNIFISIRLGIFLAMRSWKIFSFRSLMICTALLSNCYQFIFDIIYVSMCKGSGQIILTLSVSTPFWFVLFISFLNYKNLGTTL